MDIKSLKNCREVSKPRQNHIDISNLLWIKIVNKLGGIEAFQLACKNGHSKLVQMILQNPSKFDIDVNAQNKTGEAGFELACKNGHSNIVELLIQKSFELKIDLNRGRRNFEEVFRRPSQLRWGASNSLILREEEEGEEILAF